MIYNKVFSSTKIVYNNFLKVNRKIILEYYYIFELS